MDKAVLIYTSDRKVRIIMPQVNASDPPLSEDEKIMLEMHSKIAELKSIISGLMEPIPSDDIWEKAIEALEKSDET